MSHSGGFCGPAVAVLLFHGAAGKCQPAVIEIIATHGEVRPPDHDGCLFDQNLVFLRAEFLGFHE